MSVFKRRRFPALDRPALRPLVLPLRHISYRDLEDMMAERGIAVDHVTLNHWIQRYAPELEKRAGTRRSKASRSCA